MTQPVTRSAPRPSEVPHLDALRALGALAVLTTHMAFWAGALNRNGTGGIVLGRLDVGVAIFFVLSGFLLSRGWLVAAAAGAPRPAPGHYLWKRWWRIAPLALLTTVVALALLTENDDLTPVQWLAALTLTSTFVEPSFPAGLTHFWSLSVEVQFYLLLPLLMLLACGRRGGLRPHRVAAVALGMGAVSVWWDLHGAAWATSLGERGTTQWLPGYLGWFALGIALALVRLLLDRGEAGRLSHRVARLAAQPGVCWAMAAGLLLVSATPLAGPVLLAAPTEAQSLTKSLLFAGVAGLLVLPAALRGCALPGPSGAPDARRRTGFDVLLLNPVSRRLGVVSYGLFCLHLPLSHLVMHVTGWELFATAMLPLWLLTAGLSVLAAELAYRVVEEPALRLKTIRPLRPLRRRRAAGRTGASGSVPASASSTTTGTSAR